MRNNASVVVTQPLGFSLFSISSLNKTQNFRDEPIFAMPDLDEEEADEMEDEDEKPSTSKKRRI